MMLDDVSDYETIECSVQQCLYMLLPLCNLGYDRWRESFIVLVHVLRASVFNN